MLASAPPNPKDPCVSGTKNICGTTGVGYYKTYRYGTRWLGDFKGAIPNTSHTYCIDLRFWYPGPAYKYKEDTSGVLKNKAGEVVPAVNQQRIAYAIWDFGRSTSASRRRRSRSTSTGRSATSGRARSTRRSSS